MDTRPPGSSDPAALAEEVRSLANDAYRSLNGPVADAPAALELSRRIGVLKHTIDRLDADELSLWLETLRRRIDCPTAALPTPRGPLGRSSSGDGSRA